LAANQKIAFLVAEEDILHEIENQPRTSTRRLANHLGVFQFVVWLQVQNIAQEIRQNKGILNRVRLKLALQTMASILINFFGVSFYTFTHNYSLFTLFLSLCCSLNKL
jgi:hypothetical protein